MDTDVDQDTLKEALQAGVPLASGAAVSLGPVGFAIVTGTAVTGAAAVFAARKFTPGLASRLGIAKRGTGLGAGRPASGRLAGRGTRSGLRSSSGGRGSSLLGKRSGKAGGLLGRSSSKGLLSRGTAAAARAVKGRAGGVTAGLGKRAATAAAKRAAKGMVGSGKRGLVGAGSKSRGTASRAGKGSGRAAGGGGRRSAGSGPGGSRTGSRGSRSAAGGAKRGKFGMPFGNAARKRRAAAGRGTTTRNGSGGHNGSHKPGSWRDRMRARREEAKAKRKTANQMVDDAFIANRRGLTRDRYDDNRGGDPDVNYDLTPTPDRRHTEDTPPPPPTRRSSSRRSTTMPDPFEAPKEAVSTARSNFDPENANAVVEWSDGLPDYVDQNVQMLRAHAEKIIDRVRLVPEYGEAIQGFTTAMARLGDQVAESGAILKNRHAEQLEKIKRQDPRDTAWDNSKNPAA